MAQSRRLFLLDAMALIYRAYFAFNKNPRINSRGLNTSAVLGFANSLFDILKNEQPSHICIAFDTPAPTQREMEYIEYKANREAMPEDISRALPYIRQLCDAFNIPILEADGYEADDVIGTLAKKAEDKGFFTYMVTPDKDFGQLVSENIFIFKPPYMGNKSQILGVKEICEKYGIRDPKQLIDILGLWGDASDNIPGIPGIGEKRAKELIGQYGSLEKVLENTDQLKGKMKENLENFAEQGLLSKQLATIILDVPVTFDEEQFKVVQPDEDKLKELFAELEFRAFAKRVFTQLSLKEKGEDQEPEKVQKQTDLFSMPVDELEGAPGHELQNIEPVNHRYSLIKEADERQALIQKLGKQSSFCFDTETTGLDPNNAELVGISFSFSPHEAYFIYLPENFNECHKVINEFKSVLEDEAIEKIGQNLKYDISILRWYEINVSGPLFDTMLAHYLIEPDLRHNMDFLAEAYLDYKTVPIESLIGKKGKNQLSIRSADPEVLAAYACEDADITLQLMQVFRPMLGERGLEELFNRIEMPLVPVLSSMEREGISLDTKALEDFSQLLEKEVGEVRGNIYTLAGTEFNVASPKQLGEILYTQLQITKKPPRTKTKQFSTSEDVLSRLINKHEIVPLILEYRSLTKLKSTYVDALPMLVSPRDKRIHTSYNQAVASTGRLSSNNPNMQNIPIRTERGREIRKAFVPRGKGFTLLAADYSQIELRIIAELSQDHGMLEAFREGIDIHAATAAKVYDIPLEEVTSEKRRNAKMVNFGIVYGISAFGLSERLNIARKEAAEIINAYFTQYPGVKEYMERTILFAKENGYVQTIMGRRRYLRDINSGNSVVRGYAERNAINAPIQGSSADMIKIAMINIHEELTRLNLRTRMLLQVHDELVFDTYIEELETVMPIIEDRMKNAIPMSVPIIIDMNTGSNWLEAH